MSERIENYINNTSLDLPKELYSNHLDNAIYQTILQTASSLCELEINGTRIKIPYWMNNSDVYAGTPLYKNVKSGGKFSQEELREKVMKIATSQSFDLIKDPEMTHYFMLVNGLGVDCSGFVYHSLEQVYNFLGGESDFKYSMKDVFGENGGITRTAARHIAMEANAFRIYNIGSIRPADVILCENGRHIILIAGTTVDTIYAIHTTDVTSKTGVHSFRIHITKPQDCIFSQKWEEELHNRTQYGLHLNETKGQNDGIWRVRAIDVLQNNARIA